MQNTVSSHAQQPKIPPVVWFALAAVAQQTGIRRPGTMISRLLSGGVLGFSGWLLLGSIGHFRRRGTTVDPLAPDKAAALVTDGPNSRTRNPMYLGATGMLAARAILHRSPLGLLPAAAFALVIDRLQIPAEEAALHRRFPKEYPDYVRAVPRWL